MRDAYNGDGLRTTRTIGGAGVSYVWDQDAGLPVILQDSAGNRYVYGLDLLTRISGTSEEWYLTDGLGSTTGITDDTGAVTGAYAYDVFGATRTQTGATTEWSYTGEQVDATGLQYLRARYYDAATGRFANRDPLPLLQRYAYVGNNPVNLTDPTGEFPCPGCGKVKKAAHAVVSATVTATNVVAPVVFQCAVWGGAGALVGGGVAGAAVGCATGAASYLLQEYGPNNPYLQCAVWGVGGAAAAGSLVRAAAFGAGGCVGGLAGFFEDSSSSGQCVAWALAGAVSFVANPSTAARGWGTAVGCVAGITSTYGAELQRNDGKE